MRSCFTTSQVLWEKRRKRKHILLISGKERRRPGKKSGKLWEIVPFLLWRYGRSRSIPMGSHFARGGSILYDIWKLKAPSAVQAEMVDADTPYKVVSLEALPEYTGDFILYGVLADTDSSFVEESRLWNSLDAVKAGRVLAYEQVAFMHRDPITLNAQLDIFVDFFRSVGEKE